MRTYPVLLAVVLAAAPVRAAVIANGSAPPDPANVIDDARYGVGATLYVRNVGCPPGGPESDPCPAPGAPTSIEYLAPAASALWALHVRDASHALVSGGAVRTSITTAESATESKSALSMFLVLDRSGSMSFKTDDIASRTVPCKNWTESNWGSTKLKETTPCYVRKIAALKSAVPWYSVYGASSADALA